MIFTAFIMINTAVVVVVVAAVAELVVGSGLVGDTVGGNVQPSQVQP